MVDLRLESLTCEYRTNLLGTDVKPPRFAWNLISESRGTYQLAYQIQVAGPDDNFEKLIWNTGRIESDQSIQVEYAGPELQSRTRYHFRVKVWDGFGRESAWSETMWWETGLYSSEEWKAQWITPDPQALEPDSKQVFMLRKRFETKPGIRSARIYATAAGVYEICLNGSRI